MAASSVMCRLLRLEMEAWLLRRNIEAVQADHMYWHIAEVRLGWICCWWCSGLLAPSALVCSSLQLPCITAAVADVVVSTSHVHAGDFQRHKRC